MHRPPVLCKSLKDDMVICTRVMISYLCYAIDACITATTTKRLDEVLYFIYFKLTTSTLLFL